LLEADNLKEVFRWKIIFKMQTNEEENKRWEEFNYFCSSSSRWQKQLQQKKIVLEISSLTLKKKTKNKWKKIQNMKKINLKKKKINLKKWKKVIN